jgi:hypothetical protein
MRRAHRHLLQRQVSSMATLFSTVTQDEQTGAGRAGERLQQEALPSTSVRRLQLQV